MKRPEAAVSGRPTRLAVDARRPAAIDSDEAVVQRQVMTDRVLPAAHGGIGAAQPEVREAGGDVAVDVGERGAAARCARDRHRDQRHVRVRRPRRRASTLAHLRRC